MAAVGNLDISLVEEIKVLFEQNCVELLVGACQTLKANKPISTDWGEENISANIYTYIKDSQASVDADIHVESEHPFYNQDILNNKKKARKAPRIDLVFQHNWSGQRMSYYVEAKNLVEHDFTKSGRIRKVRARNVLKRYIETGVDHFLSSHYHKGCLLGYVLNGTIEGVANALNVLFVKNDRGSECIRSVSGNPPWVCFKSNHTAHSMELEHYFFDFN